ncbi:N-acetylglucosaminyl transferase component-domain-containing protein [Gongronella butleri]|nr:N-acetylglucosaminyl transferase component-domain-containing protein [Gongronella butleri]
MNVNGSIPDIYWPYHLSSPKVRQGYLVGWHHQPLTFCVAAVISDIELDALTRLIDQFCADDMDTNLRLIRNVCHGPPSVLGELARTPHTPSNAPYWLNVDLSDKYLPIPTQLSVQGAPIRMQSYQLIFYEQPNPERLQFFGLEPLPLDISRRKKAPISSTTEQVTRQNQACLVHNGRDILGMPQEEPPTHLAPVLAEINSSFYLEQGIRAMLQQQERQQRESGARDFWAFGRVPFMWLAWAMQWPRKVMVGLCLSLGCVVFAVVEMILYVLALRIPKLQVSFKDISAAGQQIDLRLQQLYFWPRQYVMLRRRNWANTAEARAYYINFYNSMWLVANDIIIGVAVGSYLMGNCDQVSQRLHETLKGYTVDSLTSMMYWFLKTPAGLKLNIELGRFLSELFLWLIQLWVECMRAMEPWTARILWMIGYSGIFGVSMVIALLSDMLAVLTMHLYCFYMVAARIFNWQLVTVYALFNLFRGKKRNMLRHRIDNCDYDLDQLLLGTCLFTLLTFLFPTVFLYYLTFALGRICVIFLQAIMETLLAFFNHFPLFAIMLRVKDPDRVPGGIRFDVFPSDTFLYKHHWLRQTLHDLSTLNSSAKRVRFRLPDEKAPLRGTLLRIKNTPVPFGAIFFQYMLLWKRLSAHYFSSHVFRCFLYGEPIKPSPKLQYPMLPDTRPPLKTILRMLRTMWNK